jgi:hypothetical protein
MFSISYRKYERSPKTVDLDFKNPRLVGYLKRESISTQKDLVVALATHYDVLGLCSNIIDKGFHPDETLIVIPDEGGKQNRVTVLEGNRRLAACKILINPKLLKGTALYSKVTRLVAHPNYSAAVQTIKSITVVEIDGRTEAFSYIASKHTQESIKPWSPYTQGAYFLSFKTANGNLSDIRKQLGQNFDLSKIKHRVLFYKLGEYILDMNCWSTEEKTHLIANIDDLKIEAIIRLISSAEFKDKIATINIDEHGELYCEGLNAIEFDRIIERLARSAHFADADNGDYVLSTRQENKEDVSNFIDDCVEFVRENTDLDDSNKDRLYLGKESDNDGEIDPDVQPEEKKKRRRKWNTLLDKDNIVSPTSNVKLNALVDEAFKLRVSGYEHSAALLSRAIMEVTFKIWLKKIGKEPDLKAKFKEKAFDFSSLLQFIESNCKDIVSDEQDAMKAIRSAVQGLLQRDKEILNLTNHNDYQTVSPKDMSEIQSKLRLFASYFFPRLT